MKLRYFALPTLLCATAMAAEKPRVDPDEPIRDGYTMRFGMLARAVSSRIGKKRFNAAFGSDDAPTKPRFRIFVEEAADLEPNPILSTLVRVPLKGLKIQTRSDGAIVVSGGGRLKTGDLFDVSNSPEYFDAHRHEPMEKAYLFVTGFSDSDGECDVDRCLFWGHGWEHQPLAFILTKLLAADNEYRKARGLEARTVEQWLAAKDATGRHAGPAEFAQRVDPALLEKNFPPVAEAEEPAREPFVFVVRPGVSPSDAIDAFMEGPTVADGRNSQYTILAQSIRDVVGKARFDAAYDTTGTSGKPPFLILPDGKKRDRIDPVESTLTPVPVTGLQIKTGPDGRIIVRGKSILYVGDLFDVSNSPEYYDAHRHSREEKAYLFVIVRDGGGSCRIDTCHFAGLGWNDLPLANVMEELLKADNDDRKKRGLKPRTVEEWLAATDARGRHAGPAEVGYRVDAALLEKAFPVVEAEK